MENIDHISIKKNIKKNKEMNIIFGSISCFQYYF